MEMVTVSFPPTGLCQKRRDHTYNNVTIFDEIAKRNGDMMIADASETLQPLAPEIDRPFRPN